MSKAEDFEALLSTDYGVEAMPTDGPAFVAATDHHRLAATLKERGYTLYAFIVASHYAAKEGAEDALEAAGYFDVVTGLRTPSADSHLASWRVRVGLDDAIDTLVDLFAGADWQEREQYDLLGVRFAGHPDLRRIMLPEDWEGHPLQREYAIDTPHPPWR